MKVNSPPERLPSYLEVKAAFPKQIPAYISPKVMFLFEQSICLGFGFLAKGVLPKRYTVSYPAINASIRFTLGYFIGKGLTTGIYYKSSSDVQKKSLNALQSVLPQKEKAIYTVLNTIHDEGACCGICLTAAKILKEQPTLTLCLLEKALTSPKGIVNSLLFQKSLAINLVVREGYSELIPFFSIASACINAIGEALRKHHIHEISKIPKEEIECHNCQDLTFPKNLDKIGVYSLVTSFDDKFLIVNIALSLGKSHAILFFSSKEKGKHFYIDPNQGLFSFNTKKEFSLGVAQLIEKKYGQIKPATLTSFTAIDSTKN